MIVIVQPWFSAVGHPAQSLVNLAKIIGANDEFIYLISVIKGDQSAEASGQELKMLGDVFDYSVRTPSVREGTLKVFWPLKKLLSSKYSVDGIFFLDAHLVLLSGLWPLFPSKNIKQLGVVYLMGPERVTQHAIVRWFIRRFLKRKEVVLFLRTEELVADWRLAFPKARIKCLPSLEIPFDCGSVNEEKTLSKMVRLGALGQIRAGKSLEWLVPFFKDNSSLGKLTVAGAFSQPTERTRLAFLDEFDGFQEGFLTENDLLTIARKQDYLLMLYDNWDHRMEGAVMFLAARVDIPVIVFEKGWCGRMINTYGNGVFAPWDIDGFKSFVEQLPSYGSGEYKKLLEGVVKFKNAHSGKLIREDFLHALRG